ncbi:hypothetical protein D3C72_1778920 [compost metagenome]
MGRPLSGRNPSPGQGGRRQCSVDDRGWHHAWRRTPEHPVESTVRRQEKAADDLWRPAHSHAVCNATDIRNVPALAGPLRGLSAIGHIRQRHSRNRLHPDQGKFSAAAIGHGHGPGECFCLARGGDPASGHRPAAGGRWRRKPAAALHAIIYRLARTQRRHPHRLGSAEGKRYL